MKLFISGFVFALLIFICLALFSRWANFKHRKKFLIKKFKTPGTKVSIKQNSPYASQNNGSGIVVAGCYMNGWTRVRFDDGSSNNYRTGEIVTGNSFCQGFSDLELEENTPK